MSEGEKVGENEGLTRQETAQKLGIALRTLDKYRAEGRITPTFIQKDRKKVARFSPEDVEAFQQILTEVNHLREKRIQTRKDKARAQEKATEERRIRFTLSAYHFRRLKEEADRTGSTPQDYARALIREGTLIELSKKLDEEQRARVRLELEVETLKQAMKESQDLTARAFAVVLEQTGVSPENADKWVKRNLLKREKG